jgi:hypothetical protein
MFFGKRIEKILRNKTGQVAIIEITNLLTHYFLKNPEKLTLPERNIVYIIFLEMDINNDGFSGYFLGYASNYTKETLDALKIIGSKIFLKIFEDAINRFHDGIVPIDRFEREEIVLELLEKKEDLWEDLDIEFYKYEEDIYSLMIDYIKRNINDFR